MENVFFTNSIMVREMPPAFVEGDPPSFHGQMEAINKIHRFCHEIYNIPITWLSDHRSMVLYKDMYNEFKEKTKLVHYENYIKKVHITYANR